MKLAVVLFSGILITAAGCSSLQVVNLHQDQQWIGKAQADLLNKEVTLVTNDGRVVDGIVVALSPDSLWMSNQWATTPFAFPLDKVWSVQPPKKPWAPVVGALGGALAGGLIGGAVAAAARSDEPEWAEVLVVKPARTMSGIVTGLLIGGAAGAVIMGVATSTTEYRFHQGVQRITPGPAPTSSPDSVRTRN